MPQNKAAEWNGVACLQVFGGVCLRLCSTAPHELLALMAKSKKIVNPLFVLVVSCLGAGKGRAWWGPRSKSGGRCCGVRSQDQARDVPAAAWAFAKLQHLLIRCSLISCEK